MSARAFVTAAVALAAASTAAAQETSLTVYQDGRVIVRRALPVSLVRGTNTVPLDLGGRSADPASLFVLDEGVELRALTVSPATGLEGSMRLALGREIDFFTGGDSLRFVRGTLLSMDPPAVRVRGRVLYEIPGRPAFPDSLVRLEPRAEAVVEAARAQRGLRVGYLATGLNWRASYTLVVPATGTGRGTFTGLATIQNPGALTFLGAEVQLLAGDVRRVAAPGRRAAVPEMAVAAPMAMAAGAVPAEETVGETHVYSLQGPVDLVSGETRSVALFAAAAPDVERAFSVRSPAYGHQRQWGAPEQEIRAEVTYLVRRAPGSPFGAVALPAGTIRIFGSDAAGRPQLLGEVAIGHTAPGRELRLATGTAFDITAQRTQLTFEQRTRREVVVSYRVQLQNAKDDTVTVQVYDEFPGNWEVLSSTVRAERLSSTTVRFPVVVPPGGEAVLEYRVRVRW